MKKTITIRILSLVLFFICQIGIQAQPRFTSGTKSQGDIFGCSEFCWEELGIEVPLANLELFSPNGSGNYEFFPDTYPDMYLNVELNGTSYQIPIEYFVFDEILMPQNISMFLAEIVAPFDVCDLCSELGSGIHNITVRLELVEENSNGSFSTYPACNYTSYSDIFSCGYTDVSCAPNSPCLDEILTREASTITIRCGAACDPELPEGGGVGLRNSSSSYKDLDISLNGNPITNTLTLANKEVIEDCDYKIFNTKGEIVFKENNSSLRRVKQIDLSLLESGLYFIQLQANDDIQTLRFIKM